jgi:outer membrane protein assembly factor BamB
MINRIAALVVLVSLLSSAGWADDWPQWRGPNRNGISQEKGLQKTWPKDGPKLLWTYKQADLGFSAPAVVGDTLYFLGTRNDKDEVVIALDANKGTELWTATIGPMFTFEGNVWGDGPRSTPIVDGNILYVLGGQGDLVCLDRMAKGKEIWRVNMIKDLGGEMMPRSDYNWGYSESPLVDGDLVLCTPGSTKGTVAALDKKTGKVQWRSTELTKKAPYSSIMAADIHGVRQYIQNSYDNEGGYVSGIAAKDGKVLWTMPIFKGDSFAIVPTPIIKGNLVYITSGYGGGCHLFEIDKDMKAKDLYPKSAQKRVKNTHGGVVLVGDHVYGHTERNSWFCQEFMTGKLSPAWEENNSLETNSGAITSAEGMLYLLSEEGEVVLVEADPQQFKETGRFKLPEASKYPKTRTTSRSSRVWTHPVIANGRLYLRDHEFLFCYDIRAGK